MVGNMFATCRQPTFADPINNIFYTLTHEADSFGFSDTTFQQLQTLYRQHQPADFKSAFYFYQYGCGYYHTTKKDEQTALQYADSMLLVVRHKANKTRDWTEIAIANLSKGDILFALQQYNEACVYYCRGKIAAEKSGDLHTLGEYSYRLGMVMYQKDNYAAAARYFAGAANLGGYHNNSFSDFYRRQEVLNNAALSYLHSGKPDSAVWYSKKGLRYIAENMGKYPADKNNLLQVANGVMYGTLGQASLQLQDTAGIALLQKSIAINAAPGGDNKDALQQQTSLAGYYLDTASAPQLSKAHVVLAAIRQGLDTVDNKEATTRWNELMSRYYALTGNKTAAYDYLARYHLLYGQQVADSKALKQTNITSRIMEMQNHYEMSLLKAKTRLNNVYLQLALLLCLFTAIILILIVRNWKKERRNSYTLAALNKQVQQQTIRLEASVKQLNKQ